MTNAFVATDEFIPSKAEGFMVAVGFVHFLTGEPLNDPRYVKWVNSYAAYIGGVYTPLQAHNLQPCSEADFEKFYPPQDNIAAQVE